MPGGVNPPGPDLVLRLRFVSNRGPLCHSDSGPSGFCTSDFTPAGARPLLSLACRGPQVATILIFDYDVMLMLPGPLAAC